METSNLRLVNGQKVIQFFQNFHWPFPQKLVDDSHTIMLPLRHTRRWTAKAFHLIRHFRLKFQFDVIEIRFCVFVGKNSGNQFIESLLKTQPELRVLQKPPEKQSGYSIRGIAVIAIINSIGKDIKIHILEARIAIEENPPPFSIA